MPSSAAMVDEFERALLALDRLTAARLLTDLDSNGFTTQLREGLVVPALTRIGAAWERREVALSQVYMSGRLCQEIIEAGPQGPGDAPGQRSRIAIGVLDDTHTLGKTIVLQMLRASGYQVLDLGARLTVADFVREVERQRIETLMVSVLMLRSALQVADLRAALDRRQASTTVVVGGAPFRFDPVLWAEVGANGVGFNASDALTIVERIEAGG